MNHEIKVENGTHRVLWYVVTALTGLLSGLAGHQVGFQSNHEDVAVLKANVAGIHGELEDIKHDVRRILEKQDQERSERRNHDSSSH